MKERTVLIIEKDIAERIKRLSKYDIESYDRILNRIMDDYESRKLIGEVKKI